MPDIFLGYLLAIGALLLFTLGILVAKLASNRLKLDLGFLIATSVNVAFAALALVVQLVLRAESIQWNAQGFWLFAAAGGFSTYLGRWFFYESVVRFGPAKASLFQVSSPLFTALIAWLTLGERLTLQVGVGIVMAICGLVLVSYKPGRVGVDGFKLGGSTRDRMLQSVLLLGLGSSLAYAISNVLRGIAVRGWNEPVAGALAGAVAGLALHLAFSRGKKQVLPRLRQASQSGILLYALMGVCTIAAQMCLIGSMRYIPVSVAALMTLCTPVLVFPLSYWLLKDRDAVTAATLAGAGLTLVGMALVVTR
jgi:drug/metabolite transporter (DMT)-like permease